MRLALIVVPLGLVSGFAGSLLAQYVLREERREPEPLVVRERSSPPAPAAVAPPGWDPRFLTARVTELEQKMRDAKDASRDKAPPDETQQQRQQERAQLYQRELALREQVLTAHAQEAVDTAWAEVQASKVQKAYPAGEVECRSETCTVKLGFASPNDALTYLGSDSARQNPEGCRGSIAIPAPPTSAGEYTLTVLINNCRQ